MATRSINVDLEMLKRLDREATAVGETGWYVGTTDERLPGASTVWTGASELTQVAATDSPATARLIAEIRNQLPAIIAALEQK